jgi:hypothetical protein
MVMSKKRISAARDTADLNGLRVYEEQLVGLTGP